MRQAELLPARNEPGQCQGEATGSVAQGNPQLRMPLKYTTSDQRRGRDGVLAGKRDELQETGRPHQPVLTDWLQWVHEDRCTQPLCRLEKRLEAGITDDHAVDVGADFDAPADA